MKPLVPGQRVTYHGSLVWVHGDGTVTAVYDFDHPTVKSDDGHRYEILLDHGPWSPYPIHNVRRQSFTPLDQIVEGEDL